jgi:acyltransferase
MAGENKGGAVPQSESRRIVFIDVLRLIAAVQMVQGHTLDALLATELRHGPLFQAWTFARGLTSTAFLVAAGLAVVLAQDASWLDPAAGRKRRLWRALRLVLIGYAMHAPLGILLGQDSSAALRELLAVDVLQCIGMSVALLELLPLLTARRRVRAALACALGAACFVAVAPADALVGPALAGSWRGLANYLSASGGSLFPLLPWAGFVFAGMGVGLWLLPERGGLPPVRCALGLAVAGSALLLPALLRAPLAVRGLQLSPAACALRLGLVLWFAAGLVATLEGRLRLPRLLARLASETLFVYVSHVLVLYAGGVGLAHLIGPRLGLGSALFWVALLLLGSAAGALGYRRALQSLRRRLGGGTPSRPQPAAETPSS